ncbi:AMP-binding protein, partial [bacterium]|nr:AMP-binding protein [bacterium]
MNIAHFVERGAHHFPDRPALHFEGQIWSYDQLHEEIRRAANGFADLGIGRGD